MDETLTVRQASKILKRPEATVRKLLNRGELQGEIVDRQYRIEKASVVERKRLLEAAGQTPESVDGRAEDLAIRLGKEMARRELTAHAQSSLEQTIVDLRRELDSERERRIRAEAELSFLRRPILKRLLG